MNPVLFWNDVALEVHRRDFSGAGRPEHDGPTRTSRALAIVHFAVYDAVARLRGQPAYNTCFRDPTPQEAASLEAVVGSAAATALAALWDRQRDFIAEQAAEYAVMFPTSAGVAEACVRYGRDLAESLLAARAADGHDAPSYFAPSGAPLRHRNDPNDQNLRYLGPQWGAVRPFLINNGKPSPVAGLRDRVDHARYLSSWSAQGKTGYAKAFDQVKLKGAAVGSTRTPEETVIGVFWAYDGARGIGTPPRLYNQCVRAIRDAKIGSGHAGDPASDALLFALVHGVMADAGIVAWAAKYHYDLWRPAVGIREHDAGFGPGLGSGLPPTGGGDPFWRALGAPSTNRVGEPDVSPPFPAYPSGHASFGTACLEVTRAFFGGEDVAFDLVSDELNGRNRGSDGTTRVHHRRRLSISKAITENIESRVFLGVHWIFDGEGGREVGESIVKEVAATWLPKMGAALSKPSRGR